MFQDAKLVTDRYDAWTRAREKLKAAERERLQAWNSLENAVNNFGALMCPDDAKPGETFAHWFGSRLLVFRKTSSGAARYRIEWRDEKPIKPNPETPDPGQKNDTTKAG